MDINHIINMQLVNAPPHGEFTTPPHYSLQVQNASQGGGSGF